MAHVVIESIRPKRRDRSRKILPSYSTIGASNLFGRQPIARLHKTQRIFSFPRRPSCYHSFFEVLNIEYTTVTERGFVCKRFLSLFTIKVLRHLSVTLYPFCGILLSSSHWFLEFFSRPLEIVLRAILDLHNYHETATGGRDNNFRTCG